MPFTLSLSLSLYPERVIWTSKHVSSLKHALNCSNTFQNQVSSTSFREEKYTSIDPQQHLFSWFVFNSLGIYNHNKTLTLHQKNSDIFTNIYIFFFFECNHAFLKQKNVRLQVSRRLYVCGKNTCCKNMLQNTHAQLDQLKTTNLFLQHDVAVPKSQL